MSKSYKKIEIIGTSSESISRAIENAVAKAAQTVHNLSWFEAVDYRGKIENGKVLEHQVTVKIGFRLDD